MMPFRPRLSSLWRNLFDSARVERELTEEIRACLELLIDEQLRAGLDPAAARRAAMLELGGMEQVKTSVREVTNPSHESRGFSLY